MSPNIPNIGPRGQRRRLMVGIAWLLIGGALGALLVAAQVPRFGRLVVFFPFWVAGLGVFQAREQTCVRLAVRGRRNMDRGDGEEAIEDSDELRQVRRQARTVHLRALGFAAVLTAVVLGP